MMTFWRSFRIWTSSQLWLAELDLEAIEAALTEAR